MNEDKLKEAFSKIKEDIFSLGKELAELRQNILENTQLMKQLNDELISLKLQKITEEPLEKTTKSHENMQKTNSNKPTQTPTHPQKIPTHTAFPMENPTDVVEIMGLLSLNNQTPIGNEGVPTDKPTHQQTNQHITQQINYEEKTDFEVPKNIQDIIFRKNVVPIKQEIKIKEEKPITENLSEASEILKSLDNLKKEIRRKFKRITKQEMLVFSTIYTIEEQDPEGADYKKIALKLGLSESSIRDYTNKLVEKGIPITKERVNNKKILLHVSSQLKNIATLDAIIQLRGL